MVETGLLDAARRNRETFAWLLLGFVGASLFVEFMALFVDRGFVVNAAGGHLDVVSPAHAAALALAVWLASLGGQATARGRLVVQVALGLVAALLLVGVVAWLGGLTLEFGLSAGAKTMGSLQFLVDGALVGVAGWFGLLVLQSMPQPQYGQPQYGQPQYWQPPYGRRAQPQYGPQYGYSQWGRPRYDERPELQAPDSPDPERTREFGAGLEPDPLPPRGLSIFDDAETSGPRPSGPAEQPADSPEGWRGRRS